MDQNDDNSKKNLQRRNFIKATAVGIAGLGIGFGVWKSRKTRKPSSLIGHASFLGVPEKEGQISLNGTKNIDKSYDMVIIGSGYGASVIAARMANEWKGSGKTIAVLERGKEYLPGDLPKKVSDIRVRSEFDKDGLFDVNLGHTDKSDLDIIGASGLGGTSLINGAIAIEPEAKVLEDKAWPKEIRKTDSLKPYYQIARDNLRSKNNEKGIKATRKSIIHMEEMRKRDVPTDSLTLNINYEDKIDYGIDRSACTMCGDCCSGCNVGAKNILPYNYLKAAKDDGANIFTYCEVTKIKKTADGYEININDNSRFTVKQKWIKAKNVVLGAGSMGSTALMLKAQSKDLAFSKTLGTRLSLNGDVLGFCYNGTKRTNAVGFGTSVQNRIFKDEVGPMISTYGNYRDKFDENNFQKRFLLLESSIPSPVAGWAAHFLAKYANHLKRKNDPKVAHFTDEQWERVEMDVNKLFKQDELSGDIKKDFGLFPATSRLSADGALNHSTLFLACGHDSASGKYVLDSFGRIQTRWDDVAQEDFLKTVSAEMKRVAESMGGLYFDNPRTVMGGSGKMQATHPLGGCPMGDDHTKGVVNHKGQVFTDKGTIHKGLYVVDAAIIPRSLGATPLLTITALAERIFEFMKDDVA